MLGKRFGRWTVLSLSHVSTGRIRVWNCRCDCGIVGKVYAHNLRGGRTTSCGCAKSSLLSAKIATHGKYDIPEYDVWQQMIQRCENPRHKSFHLYGGRGISVTRRWKKFENFYRDIGPRPSKHHSIERVDNSLGYFRRNCVWATRVRQQNNMRSNVRIEIGDIVKTFAEWCRFYGIDQEKARNRFHQTGRSIEKTFNAVGCEVF